MNFRGGNGKEEGVGGSHTHPMTPPSLPRLAGAAKPPVLGLHLGPKHPDTAPAPHPGA